MRANDYGFVPDTYGAVLVVFYSGVVYLNVRIWRRMRENFSMVGTDVNRRVRDTQRQFNIVLLLQAAAPFVSEILPGSLVSSTFLLGLNLRYGSYILTILYQWMPVLNPAMTIMLLTPYRRVVVGAGRRVVSAMPGAGTWLCKRSSDSGGNAVTPFTSMTITKSGAGADSRAESANPTNH